MKLRAQAAPPVLDLAAEAAADAPDRAILRQVQDEHRAWRQDWTIGPDSAPYGRRPWSESPGPRQPNRPWDGPTLLQEQGRNRAFTMGGVDGRVNGASDEPVP